MPSHGLQFDRKQNINDTNEFDYDTTLLKYKMGRATYWDRTFLAESKRTDQELLKKFLIDPEEEVRKALARNEAVDLATLEQWSSQYAGTDKLLADSVVGWKKTPPDKGYGDKGFIMNHDNFFTEPKE